MRDLIAQKLSRTCGLSPCVPYETLPSTPLDDATHPISLRVAARYLLPRMAKAKAKAVRKCGDAPSREVDWLSGRNGLTPGHQVPLAAVGEHHPRGSTRGSSVA